MCQKQPRSYVFKFIGPFYRVAIFCSKALNIFTYSNLCFNTKNRYTYTYIAEKERPSFIGYHGIKINYVYINGLYLLV